jgi:hypothetical protein
MNHEILEPPKLSPPTLRLAGPGSGFTLDLADGDSSLMICDMQLREAPLDGFVYQPPTGGGFGLYEWRRSGRRLLQTVRAERPSLQACASCGDRRERLYAPAARFLCRSCYERPCYPRLGGVLGIGSDSASMWDALTSTTNPLIQPDERLAIVGPRRCFHLPASREFGHDPLLDLANACAERGWWLLTDSSLSDQIWILRAWPQNEPPLVAPDILAAVRR